MIIRNVTPEKLLTILAMSSPVTTQSDEEYQDEELSGTEELEEIETI